METDWREKYYALSDKFREATEKTLQTSLITSADLLQLTKSNGILEKELVLVREENATLKLQVKAADSISNSASDLNKKEIKPELQQLASLSEMEPSIAGDLMNEEMQTENQFNLKFQSGTAGGTGTEMGINGAPNLPVFEKQTSSKTAATSAPRSRRRSRSITFDPVSPPRVTTITVNENLELNNGKKGFSEGNAEASTSTLPPPTTSQAERGESYLPNRIVHDLYKFAVSFTSIPSDLLGPGADDYLRSRLDGLYGWKVDMTKRTFYFMFGDGTTRQNGLDWFYNETSNWQRCGMRVIKVPGMNDWKWKELYGRFRERLDDQDAGSKDRPTDLPTNPLLPPANLQALLAPNIIRSFYQLSIHFDAKPQEIKDDATKVILDICPGVIATQWSQPGSFVVVFSSETERATSRRTLIERKKNEWRGYEMHIDHKPTSGWRWNDLTEAFLKNMASGKAVPAIVLERNWSRIDSNRFDQAHDTSISDRGRRPPQNGRNDSGSNRQTDRSRNGGRDSDRTRDAGYGNRNGGGNQNSREDRERQRGGSRGRGSDRNAKRALEEDRNEDFKKKRISQKPEGGTPDRPIPDSLESSRLPSPFLASFREDSMEVECAEPVIPTLEPLPPPSPITPVEAKRSESPLTEIDSPERVSQNSSKSSNSISILGEGQKEKAVKVVSVKGRSKKSK